jgi:tripartite-type tricarboxylate transporter receptor subunit TctC
MDGLMRIAAAWLLLLALPLAARAETYPAKPIRFIVPFPAGSATDGLARFLGQQMTGPLGQPIVVDNRPGANGITGAQAAANGRRSSKRRRSRRSRSVCRDDDALFGEPADLVVAVAELA